MFHLLQIAVSFADKVLNQFRRLPNLAFPAGLNACRLGFLFGGAALGPSTLPACFKGSLRLLRYSLFELRVALRLGGAVRHRRLASPCASGLFPTGPRRTLGIVGRRRILEEVDVHQRVVTGWSLHLRQSDSLPCSAVPSKPICIFCPAATSSFATLAAA